MATKSGYTYNSGVQENQFCETGRWGENKREREEKEKWGKNRVPVRTVLAQLGLTNDTAIF